MYESYINKIEDVGKLRNLKPGTIRTYQNNIIQFLDFINKHPKDGNTSFRRWCGSQIYTNLIRSPFA